VAGYPGDVISGRKGTLLVQPKRGLGAVENVWNGIIEHKIDTSSGQSGAPLMSKVNGFYYVWGMHFFFISRKEERLNYALAFTRQRIEQIHNWMKEMSQPAFRFYQLDSE
jgi:V8-like Glu-specific endopeptidase